MPTFRSEKQKREIPILLKPPLVEAIFELHWELQGDKQTGRLRDPSYPMMYGQLYERLKKEFPYTEDLPSIQLHPEASPYVVRHRIRKEKMGHPLIQIGPGVATVNSAGGYSWSEFCRHSALLAQSISELYPVGAAPLNFTKCELRYVNGVLLDDPKENPLAFLAEKLHIRVEMDPDLFIMNQMTDIPHTAHFTVAYPLRKPVGNLGVSAHLGQMDGKPGYLFQTQVLSVGEWAPTERKGFDAWLSDAHEAAINCFMALSKGALMDKYCGG